MNEEVTRKRINNPPKVAYVLCKHLPHNTNEIIHKKMETKKAGAVKIRAVHKKRVLVLFSLVNESLYESCVL